MQVPSSLDDRVGQSSRTSADSMSPAGLMRDAARARALVARTLGIAGIAGSVVLAVVAFRPRLSVAIASVRQVLDRATLPWDPVLEAGPEPDGLDRPDVYHAVQALSAPAAPAEARATDELPAPPRASRPLGRARAFAPTPQEIERRKQRYEAWLTHEGLERVH